MKLLRLTSVSSIAVLSLLTLQARLTGEESQQHDANWISDSHEIVEIWETSIYPESETTVKLSPSNLNFGSVFIGTTSSPQTVTLTNEGTSVLSITGIGITGTDPKDFGQTHTCGTSLKAGASCDINVHFKPTATGTRTAVLEVRDNGSDSPQMTHLTGTGIAGYCSGYRGPCGGPYLHCCAGLTCYLCGDRGCCLYPSGSPK